MEILTLAKNNTRLDLAVKGRLDAYWADHLAKHLEEAVRGGARELRLDLSEVTYVSSLGIRVLVDFYKKLAAIEGSFAITNPSPQVEKVLAMVGMLQQLLAPALPSAAAVQDQIVRVERASALYDVVSMKPGGVFRCRAIGDPGAFTRASYGSSSCRAISFPESSVAVGLGAFGNAYEDSRNRFGEFLAAAGSAAYQPTDGSNVADYIGSTESLVPEVQVLYALVCDGQFSHQVRFGAKDENGSIGMTQLLADCLELSGAKSAAVVMVAESTGLLGAWLRRSPTGEALNTDRNGGDLYSHPSIRKWLSFTPDRVHARALALIAGVVTASDAGPMVEFLRPMGDLKGHFHAAAFSYQALKGGALDVHETVRSLFDSEKLHGVLHLLCDDRGATGAGESEFVRGAAWIGPITEIVREGESA